MFQFAMDDGGCGNKYKSGKLRSQQFRMMGLRHNPYVGTFHGKNFLVNSEGPAAVAKQFIMEDTKGNPLIGVFRHSPSAASSKSLGLKSILYQDSTHAPVLSQLQVSREPKIPPHNILRSLRQIPTKVFSTASVGSQSSPSVASPDQPPQPDQNAPTCSICLAPYADGDELRTFACSHCFHNECVSKWIFHRCLDNNDVDSFNCPECRQNHVALSEAGSSRTSLAEGISSLSFLQVGENLARDCGYDFLSDLDSDLQSPCRAPAATSAPGSPRFVLRHPTGNEDGAGRRSEDISPRSPAPSNSASASARHAPQFSPRTRPPLPQSPARRALPLGGSMFGPRVMMLAKSSNRQLGIYAVPEDSYCFADCSNSNSSTHASAAASSPTGATVTSSVQMGAASGLLAVSRLSADEAVPALLYESQYSDCGAPLRH